MLVVLSIFLIHFSASANVSDFEKLSDRELISLHQKAFSRVDAIDSFKMAQDGVPASTNDFTRVNALNGFVDESDRWVATIPVAATRDIACNRYIRNVSSLLTSIKKDYEEIQRVDANSNDSLILRTRLEALSLLLKGDISLALNNAEGGLTPISQSGRQCPSLNRQDWQERSLSLGHSLDKLNLIWWGKRGLRMAFPLSSRLMREIIHQNDFHYQWAIPTFLAQTLIPVVAFEIFIGRFLVESLKLTPMVRAGLRWVTVAATTVYGAYRGYQFGNINFEPAPYIGDDWNQIQFATEKFLTYSSQNPQVYYEIASEIELANLRFNESVYNALKPAMQYAIDRFGSLKQARSLAVKKYFEIEMVMKERKNSLPPSAFQVTRVVLTQ